MAPAPRVLLLDCDAMFCAVARLVDPDGAGKARFLIVGGTRESRGVVCSASYEARAFGVRSGMSISQALRLCPEATCVGVPRRACGEKSREVGEVLREWAPLVEPASIDEFYLSLDGTEGIYRGEPLAVTAARIREAVLERTGLTVSVGGGTNRLIAKLAAEQAKPSASGRGVVVIAPGEEAAFVSGLDLAAIPGIGPRMQERFRTVGVTRVAEALRFGPDLLRQWFGPRTAEWLHRRLRGRASARIHPQEDAKSVSREETFPRDLVEDDALETELLRLCSRLARDLRRARLGARTITVKLRDHDFRTRQAGRTMPDPVATASVIYPIARGLLQKLRRQRRVPARLLGIGASTLSAAGEAGPAGQLGLFGDEGGGLESERDRRLAQVQDRLTARFGDRALRPGRLVRPDEPPSS